MPDSTPPDELTAEALLDLESAATAAQEWAATHPDEFDDMEIDVGHETIAELVACCAPGVVLALVNAARLSAARGERIAELEAELANVGRRDPGVPPCSFCGCPYDHETCE